MKILLTVLSLLSLACPCRAAELLLQLPRSVSPVSLAATPDLAARLQLQVESTSPEETPSRNLAARELLSSVSLGTWQMDNGAVVRLTGDRVRFSYGSTYRVNLVLRPFKDNDTVALTINRSF